MPGIRGQFDSINSATFTDSLMPDDITCASCNCDRDDTLSNKFTRYSDIRDNDPFFPTDLFEYFFRVPKAQYETIKNSMTIVEDCSNLGGSSTGGYWIDGGCDLSGSGCSVGTQAAPVLLVIAGDFSLTSCEVFGMVFVTDAQDTSTSHAIKMNGSSTLYGAVMVDHNMQQANGDLSVVFNEEVLKKANTFNGFAVMPGGWSDFL